MDIQKFANILPEFFIQLLSNGFFLRPLLFCYSQWSPHELSQHKFHMGLWIAEN
jgi:hypothetical protein